MRHLGDFVSRVRPARCQEDRVQPRSVSCVVSGWYRRRTDDATRPERRQSPTSLSHIVGQQRVTDQLRVALDCLLRGPPAAGRCPPGRSAGAGKSQIASVIGHELAVKATRRWGSRSRTVADLNALLLGAGDKEIVFIDEVHELPKVYQTALYLALDKRKIIVNGGRSFQSLPLADFTLLLGTTDEYCLLQPLRDRMRLVLRFEFYTAEELTKIVTHRAKALEWHRRAAAAPDRPTCEGNAPSRPTPPASVPACLPCRGGGDVSAAPSAEGVRPGASGRPGARTDGAEIPPALAEGATRLNVIASMLGLPTRTVSVVVEPFLLRAGLVVKDDDGRRQITAPGRDHLMKSCPEVSKFLK